MTVEELEIIVTAKVEEALKEFKKVIPVVKQMVKETHETFSKVDTNIIKSKIDQAVQFIKNKLGSLKNTNKNNEINIKVNNNEAKKNITQLEKEIETLQKKISAREIQLSITNDALDKMRYDTKQEVSSQYPNLKGEQLNNRVDLKLFANPTYTSLEKESNKFNNEIMKYNSLLDVAKSKMLQLGQETNSTSTSQNKLASFLNTFKNKLEQAKMSSKALNNTFKNLPNITQIVNNKIKDMGSRIKSSVGHVLKYATALFSLRGIYSILSQSAQSWLSSQNISAQQLSANIEYMKYAMGSVFAPVIQFVTNLVYQLMRAIQNVAYAFTGVNIFAKATASSMKNASKNAKEASKSLAGIHNEINNVSNNKNSGNESGSITPSIDLSQMENTPSSILDAIKKGNWYEVGVMIGQKINETLNNIPWNKIQNKARNIGHNVAEFLNGGIATINWKQVGNTFAQGLNTVIYFGYEFVTTFDWKQYGKAIGDSINGFFSNVDWTVAGQTLSEGIKGILTYISTAIEETDWENIGESIGTFFKNIDWVSILEGLEEIIANALIGVIELACGLATSLFTDETFNLNSLWKSLKMSTTSGMEIQNKLIDEGCKKILENMGLTTEQADQIWENKWQIMGEYLKNSWENFKITIKNKTNEILMNISEFASSTKEKIVNKVSEIKDGIKNKFQEAYNSIRNIFGNIGSFFSNVWRKCKKHIYKSRYKYRKCNIELC